MRVLIVGGGVAGLTLAAKLRQQGRQPLIIEKAQAYRDIGYGIGLYPLGSCVLHGLGVYDEYVHRGVEARRYEIADGAGEILQHVDLSILADNAGPMITLPRSDLIDILRQACDGVEIRMGVSVEAVEQTADAVRVRLSDGRHEEADLLAGCDGIHSHVRALAFAEPEKFDTHWTVWTWWGRSGLFADDLVREYWGRGFFLGAYPVPGRCMFVAGLPNEAAGPVAEDDARAAIRSALADLAGRQDVVRQALDDASAELYAWPMFDIRAPKWFAGRVVLCGDSSTAFLPTAGVGASNALRSAAALADELSRAAAATVPRALDLYVKRCQQVIRGNQDDSRTAARLAFIESHALGWGRDQLVKHYPADRIVKQIIESMRQPF